MPCPRTQQANLPACSPQPSRNAKRQAGKLRTPFFKVFWYDSTRGMNPRSTDYKADALTTMPLRRSWLVYSGESDQVFCFRCKLFGKTLSPFCSGINTWEGFSKKLKDHENGISHQECCSQWMLLAEGIRNSSTTVP